MRDEIAMMIEELTGSGAGVFVGIAEVRNTKKRLRAELIAIAASTGKGVHTVQLMDCDAIVDEWHLLSAAQNGVNAWKGQYMISRGLDVEIAVYASGQKQISRAFEQVGVTDRTRSVAIVVLGDSRGAVRERVQSVISEIGDEPREPFSPNLGKVDRITEMFGISSDEVKTLTESSSPKDIQSAVSRCVVSRVSSVALDA